MSKKKKQRQPFDPIIYGIHSKIPEVKLNAKDKALQIRYNKLKQEGKL